MNYIKPIIVTLVAFALGALGIYMLQINASGKIPLTTPSATETDAPPQPPSTAPSATPPSTPPSVTPPPAVGLANPASVFCGENGGTLSMKTNDQGEYGVCTFPSGESCEEWALFHGECDVAGVSTHASYSDGANSLSAVYRIKKDAVVVTATVENVTTLLIPRAVSASGARYATADEKVVFWEHQGEATLTIDGKQVFVGKIVK